MTEEEFDDLLNESQFKNGFMRLPIIVSVSDPNRQLNFPPAESCTFAFDTERTLQEWRPWSKGKDGAHS